MTQILYAFKYFAYPGPSPKFRDNDAVSWKVHDFPTKPIGSCGLTWSNRVAISYFLFPSVFCRNKHPEKQTIIPRFFPLLPSVMMRASSTWQRVSCEEEPPSAASSRRSWSLWRCRSPRSWMVWWQLHVYIVGRLDS